MTDFQGFSIYNNENDAHVRTNCCTHPEHVVHKRLKPQQSFGMLFNTHTNKLQS